jgi:hypothetical protein
MHSSFIAYIDESGDEGFLFKEDGRGSSRWFVLSAVVFRRVNERSGVDALMRVRQRLGRERSQPFHLCKMDHLPRLVLFHELAQLSFRTVSVLSYKPDIPDVATYQANKFLLYRDLTRLLVERISWLCRDHARPEEGDGTVELIFSDRAAMSYDDIRGHMRLLRGGTDPGIEEQIHWPAIDIDRLRAVQHSQLAGLQIADAVASSTFYAVNPNRFGITDPSYLHLLRRHVYRHERRWLGYGMKFLSDFEALKSKMPHLGAAFEDW